MASVAILAALTLLFMLAVGSALDRVRQRTLERQFDRVLSGDATDALEYLTLHVQSHNLGLYVARLATDAEDIAKLRRAVGVVEDFAPGMWEGLRAIWSLARSIDAIVALPPVRPSVWQAWVLRGYSGAAAVIHCMLVTGAERTRLRLWVIARAFRFGLRRLRGQASEEAPEWGRVRATLDDLETVGRETTLTAERVIRSLDVAGALPGTEQPEKAKSTSPA